MIKIKVFRDLNRFEIFNSEEQKFLSSSVSVLFGTITQTTFCHHSAQILSFVVWRNPSNCEMLDCTILAEEFFNTTKKLEANSTKYKTVFV